MEEVVSGYAALFDSMQVMSCLIREKDSVRLTNQQTFPSKGYQGKGSLGGYSVIMHYLFLSSLLSTQPFSCRSSCNYKTHTHTHTHTQSCVSEYLLPISYPSFSNSFSFQTKPNPCMEFRKK